MKKALLCGLCILITTPANAADWEYITSSQEGSDYYIDSASIRAGSDFFGSYTSAWFLTDDSENKSVTHRASKLLYRARCDKYELGLAHAIDYDPSGKVLKSDSVSYVRFSAVAPDTIGETILSRICLR